MTEAGDGVSWDPGRGRGHHPPSDGRDQTPDTAIVPWAETQGWAARRDAMEHLGDGVLFEEEQTHRN